MAACKFIVVSVLKVHGCLPGMGYSFAAGTTDGPGSFSFHQGMKTENPLWNAVRNFLAPPSETNVACHGAKPILLPTGEVSTESHCKVK
jgi:neutral ceramidase